MIFIDSNIWCYYFDRSADEHEAVTACLEQRFEEERFMVNTVVLMEVAHYLFGQLGAVQGREHVDTLTSLSLYVHDFDYKDFRTSADVLAEQFHTGIGGRDATIIQAMQDEGVERLVTHDRAFTDVDSVDVIDPVEEGGEVDG